LHIGGTDGIDPIQHVKDIYTTYGIRFDSDVFSNWDPDTNPDGLIGHPNIPARAWWRITEPQDLDSWVAENIYKPLGLVPFINKSGEIAPRFVFQPIDIDPSTLPIANASNIGPDHPTWDHKGATESITSLQVVTELVNKALPPEEDNEIFEADGGDGINVQEFPLIPEESDRFSINDEVHKIEISVPSVGFADKIQRNLSKSFFNKFADGPIEGVVQNLTSFDINPGEFFLIDLDTFPNAVEADGRGGKRIVQAIDKIIEPSGFEYRYLDAGPENQALSIPTISIATNSSTPRHAVDVTLDSVDGGAKTWVLQIKVGNDDWVTIDSADISTTTLTVGGLPSNTTIQARAFLLAPSRITSGISTTVSVTTDALNPPTNLTLESSSGTNATVSWTNGESEELIEILVDGVVNITLRINTNIHTLEDLPAATEVTVGVRHVDQFGGVSTTDSIMFTTGSQQPQAPKVARIGILVGDTND